MTLAEAMRVFRGWRDRPPTHRLVAAFIGVKPGDSASQPHASTEGEIDAVLGVLNTMAKQGQVPRV